MIEAAEIEQMSLAERMEAMELLWRSISKRTCQGGFTGMALKGPSEASGAH